MSSTPIIAVRGSGKTVRPRPGKPSPSLKGSICKSILGETLALVGASGSGKVHSCSGLLAGLDSRAAAR